jgi:hypothetical protein
MIKIWLKEDTYVRFLYFGGVEEYYFHNIYVYNDTSNPCSCFLLTCPWSVAIIAAM